MINSTMDLCGEPMQAYGSLSAYAKRMRPHDSLPAARESFFLVFAGNGCMKKRERNLGKKPGVFP